MAGCECGNTLSFPGVGGVGGVGGPLAVKLVLRPSNTTTNFSQINNGSTGVEHHHHNVTFKEPGRKKSFKKTRWAEIALNPLTSLSSRIAWFTAGGFTDGSKQPNAVFRSNSFSYKRPRINSGGLGVGGQNHVVSRGSLPYQSSYLPLITVPQNAAVVQQQAIKSSLAEKYEAQKDLTNRKPLRQVTANTKNPEPVNPQQNGGGALPAETENLDIVYSDPKDSKLYNTTPGGASIDPVGVKNKKANPADLGSFNKVFTATDVNVGNYGHYGEAQYCRPYVMMRPVDAMEVNPDPAGGGNKLSEYEEVRTNFNGITMITVRPSDIPVTSAASITRWSPATLSQQLTLTGTTNSSARDSAATTSSDGGSFVIDQDQVGQQRVMYENLYFHNQTNFNNTPTGNGINGVKAVCSTCVGVPVTVTVSNSAKSSTMSSSGDTVNRFGYSQKEVWNWLYSEHDLNQNVANVTPNAILKTQQPTASNTKAKGQKTTSGQIEVKFTCSEFLESYRRLAHLNIEGFAEFVVKTLDLIMATSNSKAILTKNSAKSLKPIPAKTMVASGAETLPNRSSAVVSGQNVNKNRFVPVFSGQETKQRPAAAPSVGLVNPGSNPYNPYVKLQMPESKTHPMPSIPSYQTVDFHRHYAQLNGNSNPTYVEAASHGLPVPKIDLSIPLDRQEWFHGSITRVEAETALRMNCEGSFLVRNSESSSKDYSLSVKTSRGFMHMKIQQNGDRSGYILGQFSKPFQSIQEMIQFYTRNSLPVKGAEHITLRNPICDQLL